jgi:hypothetical protein
MSKRQRCYEASMKPEFYRQYKYNGTEIISGSFLIPTVHRRNIDVPSFNIVNLPFASFTATSYLTLLSLYNSTFDLNRPNVVNIEHDNFGIHVTYRMDIDEVIFIVPCDRDNVNISIYIDSHGAKVKFSFCEKKII